MSALAGSQEKQDRDLLLSNKQRIQGMPLYWLEMLEIEILARCVKHHLNRLMRENNVSSVESPLMAVRIS